MKYWFLVLIGLAITIKDSIINYIKVTWYNIKYFLE